MLGVWEIGGLMYCNIIAILDQGLDEDLVFNLQLDSFVSSRSLLHGSWWGKNPKHLSGSYFCVHFCLLPHTVWLFTVYNGLECEWPS